MSNLPAEPPTAVEKAKLLEDARIAFSAPASNADTRRLARLLARCVAILLRTEHARLAEPLEPQEASQLFLQVTRLFQYKHKQESPTLRRLVHVAIKLLAPQVAPSTTYVAVASLAADIAGSKGEPVSIRASALRAIAYLNLEDPAIHAPLLETHLEQCLLSKQPSVTSAALLTLSRLASNQHHRHLVHRYTNHVQYLLVSGPPMAQYHALALLHGLAANQREPLQQLINLSIEQRIVSPMALCLLIRIIAEYLSNQEKESTQLAAAVGYKNFLKQHLANSEHQTVQYQAAHAILHSTTTTTESPEHKAAAGQLRNFLTSTDQALRFASLRSLNELACTVNADARFWSCHRVGAVCRLHLLNKTYRPGDHITGILDFTNSNITCAKYTIILQCEHTQYYELRQEFSLGLEKTDFLIAIPPGAAGDSPATTPSCHQSDSTGTSETTTTTTTTTHNQPTVQHFVLSFLFYTADKGFPRTQYEDRTGTIELGPTSLDTKLFTCDFPIAVRV